MRPGLDLYTTSGIRTWMLRTPLGVLWLAISAALILAAMAAKLGVISMRTWAFIEVPLILAFVGVIALAPRHEAWKRARFDAAERETDERA